MHKQKITVVACILLLGAAVCKGQSSYPTFTKSVQIHFGTGKYVLTKEHKVAIRELLDSIPKSDTDADVLVQRIVVNGNTDNEGSSEYNLNLSEKRAETVISYLGEKGLEVNLAKMNYYGETKPVAPNNDPLSKSENRRVDIEITYVVIKKGFNPMADSKGPCEHDTIITLAGGSRISMSICDYERMGGDFHITAVVGGPSVRQSGLNTMGDDGTPLMSAGMFDIKFKNDSCLKKPVTFRVPVDTCVKQPKKMRRYVYNYRNGRWTPSRARVHVVKVGKKQFYEFTVQCPGKINLDYPQSFAYTDKRKFYAKNGLKLVSLRISDDCPCSMLDGKVMAGGRRALGWVGAFQEEPFVSAKAVDKNGDTLSMQFKPLNHLLAKGKRQVTGHFLWVFPIRKSGFYDAYYIRKADFDEPLRTAAN